MTHGEAQKVILFLGIEDVSGLWEILRERQFYSMSLTEGIDLASAVLQELLRHGLVKLYRCREGYLRSESQLQEIDEADWERVLSSRDSWQEPASGSISIRFGTTPDGKAAHFGEVGD